MSDIVAVIGAETLATHGMLAREALKKAAAGLGRAIRVELHMPEGVSDPLDAATVAAATQVLLVGELAPDPRFDGKQTVRATLQEVLDAPAAVLGRLEGASSAPGIGAGLKIVAITSCPTGIAHTFMAAEGLQQGAKEVGAEIRVETQGSVGSEDALTAAEIAAADLVVIAADRQVELGRFAGKRVFQSQTKPAINDGAGLIRRAIAEAAVLRAGQDAAAAEAQSGAAPAQAGGAAGVYKHLMTGVSFMLPFVVAGGILIAIAFALGGIYVYDDAHQGTLGWTLFQIGAKGAFTLMVPALAGYIAFSIADRPGIAPGMTGGVIAGTIGAGFIGGILAGFIAGYAVLWLNRAIKLPKTLQGLKPVLILPLLGVSITGLLMFYVIGKPTAELLAALTAWLQGMQGAQAAVLGALLGGMMAVDMGGPINKAAYAFGTTLIAANVTEPMAAVMCAGMTPPLALSIATKLFANRFTAEEREAGNAAFVLGLSFVTEGAIPFAARDPFRVIPSLIAGSAVAGAICMAMGVQLKVPHGGIFVLPIPNAVGNLPGFVIAMLAGTAVSVIALRIVKPRLAAAGASAQLKVA